MENNLFNYSDEKLKNAYPLAEKLRPQTLEEFYGQKHILAEGKLLHRLVKSGSVSSCIFFGPPGTGKTTLATIIANGEGATFVKLNAVSSGVAEARAVIEQAKKDLEMYGRRTYLLLDECHRWSKAQSDQVLSAIEKGYIVFVGSTTENPFFSMTKAIVSRCRVFEFKSLSAEDIIKALKNAVKSPRGLGEYNVEVEEEAYKQFCHACGGDLRNALNSLDLAFKTTKSDDKGKVVITKEIASECTGSRLLSISNDNYYDMLSAFCKSLRGSDPDGAVYWAFRLIESGVDPQVVIRRLIVHSSEDVGMANSNAMLVAVSALTAYQNLGVPEAFIPMTHAIISVATSPKSNAVIGAMEKAQTLVKETSGDLVPDHLKNTNFMKEERDSYKYPHAFGGYVKQDYLPEKIKNEIIYNPTDNGNEKKIKEFLMSLPNKKDYKSE